MSKLFYAGSSYMGTNFTYDSPCWSFYSFDSKDFRDRWVADGEYNDQGNRVHEAVDAKIAKRYGGNNIEHVVEMVECNYCHKPVSVIDGEYHYSEGIVHPKCGDAIDDATEKWLESQM